LAYIETFSFERGVQWLGLHNLIVLLHKITVLLDYGSGNNSVESGSSSAESDIDFAQDEFGPAEEKEDGVETVTVTALGSLAQWV
jgi:hypothetical protein